MFRVLFVEDEPNLQKELEEILKQEKIEILSALDGAEGFDLAKKEKPDLILLDLILPKKDGFEVLKELKADKDLKDIPVIILTNLEQTEDVEKALNLGATTYLVKANYKLEEVVNKIREFLNK